jgi:NifB/MoaA-like Fe-S oxidoreductase
MSSVSVVPAGLTKFRDGLAHLEPFTAEECAAVLDQVNAVADRHFATHGSRLFFCSDEFYLKSGRELPDEEFYEGYPQLENGVGMLTSLRTEFFACMADGAAPMKKHRSVSLATGEAAYPLLSEIADVMQRIFPHLSVNVYRIKNNFFGEHITVAGLLTATDIIEQLNGKDLGDELLLPSAVLRADGDLFLDDVSPEQLSEKLGVTAVAGHNDGALFIKDLLGVC